MTAKLPLQTFFKTFEPHSLAEVGLNVFALADLAKHSQHTLFGKIGKVGVSLAPVVKRC
jgi:hypothetical protein